MLLTILKRLIYNIFYFKFAWRESTFILPKLF